MDFYLADREKELRLVSDLIPYNWSMAQNNLADNKTNMIYRIDNFNDFMNYFGNLRNENPDLFGYACNRWFNYHSAMCVERIFSYQDRVDEQNSNYGYISKKNRQIDFFIDGVPFDHKTTVLPRCFYSRISEIHNRDFKIEVMRWLYKNQSNGKRFGLNNRIFVMVVKKKNPRLSWKGKSLLKLINQRVEEFMDSPDFITFRCQKTKHRFRSALIVVDF